jgi:dihydrofolate reductase
MLDFWPQQPDSNPMAAHLNAMPKFVASRALAAEQLTWANSRLLDGGLAHAVKRLKAEGDGNVAVLGSGALVQQLIALELVDGYRLFLHPLLLGTGKRLFREMDHPRPLRLSGVEPTSTGVVMLSYETV